MSTPIYDQVNSMFDALYRQCCEALTEEIERVDDAGATNNDRPAPQHAPPAG